jgi:hypothetical protein
MRAGPSASAQLTTRLRYGETRHSLGEGGYRHALHALRATAFGLQPTAPFEQPRPIPCESVKIRGYVNP